MRHYTETQEKAILEEANVAHLVGGQTNLDIVRKMYSEKGRFYHTWDHALDVLCAVRQLPHYPPSDYIRAAIFHDAIYVPGAKDNEHRSAEFMCKMCGSDPEGLSYRLIMATARHGEATRGNTSEECWDFLDCDILSMAEPCHALMIENDWNVGAEFVPFYSLEDYLRGREAFLEAWLAKPSVFLGEYFGKTNEWQARQNIHFLSTYQQDFSSLV